MVEPIAEPVGLLIRKQTLIVKNNNHVDEVYIRDTKKVIY